MKIYHTKTQADYNALMIELEEKGHRWLGGDKPTSNDYWSEDKENSCIKISGKVITFGSIEWNKKEYQDIPVIEYKAKGENMLNTECKQCHKKWHHDNAKYCSMCGKRLPEEPEFKVGDIVASKIFADGSFGLVRLNEDLTNRFTSVDGFWYIKRDCAVRDESLVAFKEDTRHATPEEIAEYESALNFHKHGREPFEVKNGDLIRTPSEEITLIWNPENFTKTEFLDYEWKLLKTAEEIDEWVGVENE